MKDKKSRSNTYLDVPYEEKDEAKALGAKWDPDLKRWFVPKGLDIADFAEWLPVDDNQASQR